MALRATAIGRARSLCSFFRATNHGAATARRRAVLEVATERRGAVRGANLARLALGLYSASQPRRVPKIRRASLGRHLGHVVKHTGPTAVVRAPRWYTAQSSAGTELLQKLMPDRRSAFRSLLEPKAREMSLLSAQEAVFRGFRACGLRLTIDDALRPVRGAPCCILTD